MGSEEYFHCVESIRLDLLDLFGSGYVIEHCISALLERKKKDTLDIYLADCLKNINEILAKTYGGSYSNQRYVELINPKKEDKRTGDEIAADIIKRAGLRFSDGSRVIQSERQVVS